MANATMFSISNSNPANTLQPTAISLLKARFLHKYRALETKYSDLQTAHSDLQTAHSDLQNENTKRPSPILYHNLNNKNNTLSINSSFSNLDMWLHNYGLEKQKMKASSVLITDKKSNCIELIPYNEYNKRYAADNACKTADTIFL